MVHVERAGCKKLAGPCGCDLDRIQIMVDRCRSGHPEARSRRSICRPRTSFLGLVLRSCLLKVSGPARTAVGRGGESLAPQKARSHHCFPLFAEKPSLPCDRAMHLDLVRPLYCSVLVVGKWSGRIRRNREDPCCSSFAYLPCHLSWMSDALRSSIEIHFRLRQCSLIPLPCPPLFLSCC